MSAPPAFAHVGANRAGAASALLALAPLVPGLEALTDPARGVGASVGILRGGAARQVVPGEAELHLDLRVADQAGADWLLAEARRIAGAPPADPRVTVRVEGGFYRPPFPTGAGTERLFALALGVGAALGVPVGRVVSPGGSDGSFAAALGVPTLDGLGPVCHESCSRRERVEVDSLVPRGRHDEQGAMTDRAMTGEEWADRSEPRAVLSLALLSGAGLKQAATLSQVSGCVYTST